MRKILFIAFLLLLMIIISISTFLFFKTFWDLKVSDYANEILAAFLGAIMTMIITMVLLRSQTATEENKEKTLGIFQEKLKLYMGFIDFLNDIIDDQVIANDELREIKKWAAKIALISSDEDVLSYITEFVDQIMQFKKFRFCDMTPEEVERYVVYYNQKVKEGKYSGKLKVDEAKDCFVTIGLLVGVLKKDLGEYQVSSWKSIKNAFQYIDNLVDED